MAKPIFEKKKKKEIGERMSLYISDNQIGGWLWIMQKYFSLLFEI